MNAVCLFNRRKVPALHSLLLSYVLTAASVACAEDLNRAQMMTLARSVLKVEVVKEDGGYSLGTGVSIAPGKFVTNCHVTREAEKITVVQGGLRWPAISELSDQEYDLCVLDVPALNDIAPVPVASARHLKIGEAVTAIGFTGGMEKTLRSGVVSGLHRLNGSNVIQSTTAFTSGASGGALFDSDGHLVGILTFRLRGTNAYYFSAPVEWIAPRVANADSYGKIAPLHGRNAFWAKPLEALPYFMQAASLEASSEWDGLLKLTEKWSETEDGDAEPWFLRGNAYTRLDRREGAVKAYLKAVSLDPDFGQAWFNLGVVYFGLGENDQVLQVLAVLRRLAPALADELAVKSGTTRQ
jgi:serine protease Do